MSQGLWGPHDCPWEGSELRAGGHCLPGSLYAAVFWIVAALKKLWLEHLLSSALTHLYDLEKGLWPTSFFSFPQLWIYIYTHTHTHTHICNLCFETKMEMFSCHLLWFSLKRHSNKERGKKCIFFNLKYFRWATAFLSIADIWPTLRRFGSGRFGQRAKCGEEKGKPLCAVVHVCWCQWEGWGFRFHDCMSSIFLKCDLNLKAMFAPKTFPWKNFKLFLIPYWAF